MNTCPKCNAKNLNTAQFCTCGKFLDECEPTKTSITLRSSPLGDSTQMGSLLNIQLNHNGQQMGTFSREQVEGMVRSGVITYETLGWTDGLTAWKPLHEIIGASVPPPPPLSHAPVSKKMHPVATYFVPIGRIGRGAWLLRYMANIFGLVLLAAPFVESVDRSSLGAALWMVMLFCLFVYLTVVNTAKRLHDLNVSAWFAPLVINPIGFIVLLVLSGTDGPNKYGSKP